jgi:hypothetical protein
VGGHVGDDAKVGVDRQLVAAGVVAGGLVFEIPGRSCSVARRDPGDVGQINQAL